MATPKASSAGGAKSILPRIARLPESKSLTADIITTAEGMKPGPKGWFRKLPADMQQELLGLRDRFVAGEVKATKHALAKSIHAALLARNLIGVGWKEVVTWLGGN